MKIQSEIIVLRGYLSQLDPKLAEQLFSYLSKPTQIAINTTHTQFDPNSHFSSLIEILEKIHPSYIQTYLETLHTEDQELFIRAMPPQLKSSLQEHLPIEPSSDCHPLLEQFIHQHLYQTLCLNDPLYSPTSLLRPHPLNSLLTLNSTELNKLISLLGMRDLRIELKQIIQPKILQNLQNALSIEQKKFLKSIYQEKEQVQFAKIHLNRWDGEKKSLQMILMQRGLNRLSKSLYNQDLLNWHIEHKLDISRAKLFKKLCIDVQHEKAREVLMTQVKSLIAIT